MATDLKNGDDGPDPRNAGFNDLVERDDAETRVEEDDIDSDVSSIDDLDVGDNASERQNDGLAENGS